MGLRESIRGRVTESGGTVRIDTAPGAGTYLKITMPLAVSVRPDSGPGAPQRIRDRIRAWRPWRSSLSGPGPA